MRTWCVVLSVAFSVSGCLCSPETPKAVTLRLKNNSRDAIWVDDSRGALGLTVQRYVAGTAQSFSEAPDCACLSCESICSAACVCPEPEGRVRRVPTGTQVEREWSGVVQVAGRAPCFGQSQQCLSAENAPYNETFSLHLCYTLQAPGIIANPDGGSNAGKLPADATCVDKEFRIEDGVVEIGPARGADCVTSSDCKGTDELCFSGSCTASCPENDYPTLGSNWALRIASPDDQGFFTTSTDGGQQVFSATGTIASATYQGSTLTLRLSRKGASNEVLNGTVYITLPPGELGPLTVGSLVSVRLIDASTRDNPENRAVVVKEADAGTLLVAADVGQGGSLLSADDTAPFSVSFDSAIIGCRFTGCGRQLFSATRFVGPTQTVVLEPGKSADQVTTLGTYRTLNVSNSTYAKAVCSLSTQRPWVIWRDRAPGAP